MTKETKRIRRFAMARRRAVTRALEKHTGKGKPVQGFSCAVCNYYLGQLRSLDVLLEFTSVRPLGAGDPSQPSEYPIDD